MFVSALRAFEGWLRLDAERSPMTATRGRAIYTVATVFVVTQIVNLFAMTVDYGGWTGDHAVAVYSIIFSIGTVVALRYCRAFNAYAAAYTMAIGAGVLMASVTVGINSALLPMLVWGPVACAMIASARYVVACAAVCLAVTAHLYTVSVGGMATVPLTGGEFQRFVQTGLAVIVSGAMATVFSFGLRSALERLEENARRARVAEAAKSDFLARVSHELRTPLGGVIGLTDALASSDLGPRERELTETIRLSGQGMLAILNDLLDLSKIEAGKLEIESLPVSPERLVDSVGETWREAANARSTVIETAVIGAPDWLCGDELRLRQILNNFVSNAAKFTQDGTIRLTLQATTTGDNTRLVFRVEDTGTGIPPERQEAVFEPFEQASAGTAKAVGGTGLGLPVCRDLAGLMGGEVALVRSDETGSVFALTLCLPVAEEPAAPERAETIDLAVTRVLVADDNAVNRMVAAEFLKALGVEAVFVEDGEAAVEAASLGGFDAILMDKHMPGMDGIEATRAIRALPGDASDVSIIAVTADAMRGEREALLAQGMDGYLSKPLKLPALRDALIEAVRDRGTKDTADMLNSA